MNTRIHNIRVAKELWVVFNNKYRQLERDLFKKDTHEATFSLEDVAVSNTLHNALIDGNWESSIFQDCRVPNAAKYLYQANKISLQQFCTILERQQTFPDFQHKQTHRILDSSGEFTPEAIKHFLPYVNQFKWLPPLNDSQIADLKCLISALPLSEQIFYLTDQGKLANSDDDSLGNNLIGFGTLRTDQLTNDFMNVSVGVFDAIGLVHFGIDEYIRPIHRFGVQTINDIDHGVQYRARMTSLIFPGISNKLDDIHGFPDVTPFEATSHDKYHSFVMSTMPNTVIDSLRRLINITRENTGQKWSREIWTWVDSEMIHCIATYKNRINKPLSIQESTEFFCETLRLGNNTFFQPGRYSSLIIKNNATPALMFMMIDMHLNKNAWVNLGIDPRYLTRDLQWFYEHIGQIMPEIAKNPPMLQALKCQLYFFMRETDSTKHVMDRFLEKCHLIEQHESAILGKLKMAKVAKTDTGFLSNQRNTIYISMSGGKSPGENFANLDNLLSTLTTSTDDTQVRTTTDYTKPPIGSLATLSTLWRSPNGCDPQTCHTERTEITPTLPL